MSFRRLLPILMGGSAPWVPMSWTYSGSYTLSSQYDVGGRLHRYIRITSDGNFVVTALGDSAGAGRIRAAGSGHYGGGTTGQNSGGGGGGAGGHYEDDVVFSVQTYAITIGDVGVNQGNTIIAPQTSGSDLVVARGGEGGLGYGQSPGATSPAADGHAGGDTGSPASADGSGGGGGSNRQGMYTPLGGTGITSGGNGVAASDRCGGGGGGAGASGGSAGVGSAGAGGDGVASTITGSSETWCGGGGGGGYTSAGAGGAGGGGAGGSGGAAGTAGSAPGAGGGGTGEDAGSGAAGYRGEIIIRLPDEAP